MQQKINHDIREYKMSLRKKHRDIRINMSLDKKLKLDSLIFEKLVNSKVYLDSNVLLSYVSTAIEVDTHRLIKHALENSKVVAVPKCIAGTRDMKFYIIKSFDDLEVATFSVLEPIIDICEELNNFGNALCIVPGLAFDLNGFRLGYGKGYYDRFLDRAPGIKKIGICYCSCTVNKLIKGKFDVPVDALITEKYFRTLCGKFEK